MSRIVVIGAGQAGASLVAKLRGEGFAGQITLIGAEPDLPYQRPPLTKKYLTGEMARERLSHKPRSFYDEAEIALRLGAPVEGIDRAAQTVSVAGETLPYDMLALTTGSTPRRLPAAIGGALEGVYTVRALGDVDAMAAEFQPGRKALIVGGGYIGLEAAAVAAKLGLQVTLVEMAERILQRVAAPETADYFRALHSSHGVRLLEGAGLEALSGDGSRVSSARLTNGETLDVDFVIVGVGIAPETRLAEAAGLGLDNGIAVNALGQTSDPHIYAAGDCCSFPYQDGRLRLESVPNAIDQAEATAKSMLAEKSPTSPRIWFWSDQYDVTLQIAGLNTGYDQVVPRVDGARVSYWYFTRPRGSFPWTLCPMRGPT